MARPKRFELLTPRFVVWCSIQLSYGRAAMGPRGGWRQGREPMEAARQRQAEARDRPPLACRQSQNLPSPHRTVQNRRGRPLSLAGGAGKTYCSRTRGRS